MAFRDGVAVIQNTSHGSLQQVCRGIRALALRRARRIRRIGARDLLVPVEEAIAVAVDSDADTGARRRAGVGHLALAGSGEAAEPCVGEVRGALPVGKEASVSDIEEARLRIAVP